jgi:putative membrane protein
MKLTGLGALACAAALTIACAGDARNDQDDDANRSAAGTSGAFGDDDTTPGNTTALEDEGDAQARIGAAGDGDLSRTPTGTSGQAQGSRMATGDTRQFVQTAAMHGTAEVELGQLASERAQNGDVKAFAQMMVKDHTRANNELKQAVSGQNVDISKPQLDQKHQQLMSRLRNLTGAEFDREYMKAMVAGHREVRNLLQSRTQQRDTRTTGSSGNQEARTHGGANPTGATGTAGTGDAQLETRVEQWATKTLPSVEQHLQRAEQIERQLAK